jgi:hypothetical protein
MRFVLGKCVRKRRVIRVINERRWFEPRFIATATAIRAGSRGWGGNSGCVATTGFAARSACAAAIHRGANVIEFDAEDEQDKLAIARHEIFSAIIYKMSFVGPQFGNQDYSGFTTEEELARRSILTDARGSPAVGVQMSIPPMSPDAPISPALVAGRKIDGAMARMGPATTTQAIMQVFKSKPVTVLDWVIIFIIIVASVCFLEYMRDLWAPSSGHRHGGNFCETCGGTI